MSSYVTKPTPGDTSWFVQARFGMFIHFGLFAMLGKDCWIKSYEETKDEKYDKYFRHFNPEDYDAKALAHMAREAGMKYVVIITKHHEGFCLFDTKYTDYNVMNTPYGRDFIRETVDAFRAEGLHIGLYYSLLDWHHPDFPIDVYHPLRHLPKEEVIKMNEGRDMHRYMEYVHNQVTELLTNYGKIDVMFYDFSYPEDSANFPANKGMWEHGDWIHGKGMNEWESEKLIEYTRKLQPGIIINDRTGIEQDLTTPEQVDVHDWPRDEKTGKYLVWETCQTVNGSWGYARPDKTMTSMKTPDQCIKLLVNTVANGGNLLMNVGPDGRGRIDIYTEKMLKAYAAWMADNSKAIYSCTKADPEYEALGGASLTQSADGKRLYLILTEYPANGHAEFVCPPGRVEYARFLYDYRAVNAYDKACRVWKDGTAVEINTVAITLGGIWLQENAAAPAVIEIFLK